MKASTRALLEVHLKKQGFVREGHGFEAPNGTLGIADALLKRATVSELFEVMIARLAKIPKGSESEPARDDTQRVIEALKALIDQAL